MPQSFACLHHHFIFSTKRRQPWITSDWRPRLFEYLGGIARSVDCALIAAGGVADHVHLLIRLSREISVSRTMALLKANSSRWVHQTLSGMEQFAWQDGYAVFSVSYSNLPSVERYLAKQEDHHRKVSFQDEVLMFLKKHGIEYDERYLWE